MNKCKCTLVGQKNPDLLPREAVEAPEPKRPPGAEFNIVLAKILWLNKLSKNVTNMTKQKISREGQLKCSVCSHHCKRPLKQMKRKVVQLFLYCQRIHRAALCKHSKSWESSQLHALNKIPLLAEAGSEMQ